MSEAVLVLNAVWRVFEQGAVRLEVLKGASFALNPGEIVGLVGPSGAGKSTLLHIAGLLETPNAGRVIIEGKDCGRLSDRQRTVLRRQSIGFIYQFHHLLPELTALENVALPQRILGRPKASAKREAESLLNRMGLGERLNHRPARLSGGEQQRVAIARALANGPRILLADEPTGNLDPRTADLVFSEMLSQVRHSGVAALIATHNFELAGRMDRILRLSDGVVVEERRP